MLYDWLSNSRIYLVLTNFDISRSASLDVEPLYTFRKHLSPVLCVAINAKGDECYSGCQDGEIYCWEVPSANIDPYDSYGIVFSIRLLFVLTNDLTNFHLVRRS